MADHRPSLPVDCHLLHLCEGNGTRSIEWLNLWLHDRRNRAIESEFYVLYEVLQLVDTILPLVIPDDNGSP